MSNQSIEEIVLKPRVFALDELRELGAKPVRITSRGGNVIFEYTAQEEQDPILQEIGMQREVTFREAGGGTGKLSDIDQFDFGKNAYTQLFLWNPSSKDIMGAYRVIKFKDIDGPLEDNLASAKLFNFSELLKSDYAPHIAELGRSYVRKEYQKLSTLMGLFEGLGSIKAQDPEIEHFFGKVTTYPNNTYPKTRDLILHYLHKHFEDKDGLVLPKQEQGYSVDEKVLGRVLNGETFEEDYQELRNTIKKLKKEHPEYIDGIPPLLNSYLNLTPGKIRVFGAAVNKNFGNVEEIGIMIHLADLKDEAMNNYITSFKEYKIDSYQHLNQIIRDTA